MRRTLVTILLLLANSLLLNAYWEHCLLSSGTIVSQMSAYGNTVYASTESDAIVFSADTGATWSRLNNMEDKTNISAFAVSSNLIIYGNPNGDIRYTSNGGTDWQNVSPKICYSPITSISIKDDIIIVGTSGSGVLISYDYTHWTVINQVLLNLNVTTLEFSNTMMIVGTSGSGVYISNDSGMTWLERNSGLKDLNIHAIACKGDTIYIGTDNGGVYYSTDMGQSWIDISINTSPLTISVSEILVTDSGIFVGFSRTSIRFSDNNGKDWKLIPVGTTNKNITGLVQLGSKLFCGTKFSSIFESEDNGVNWELSHYGIDAPPQDVKSIFAEGNVIAAGKRYGIYYSTDYGDSWVSKEDIFSNVLSTEERIFVHGKYLYRGLEYANMYRSTDYGDTWSHAHNGLSGQYVYFMAIEAEVNYAYTSIQSEGFYVSSDYGESWTKKENGFSQKNTTVNTIAIDNKQKNDASKKAKLPTSDDETSKSTLYVTENGRLMKSYDHGDTWTVMPINGFNLAGKYLWNLIIQDSFFIVGVNSPAQILISTDGGINWVDRISNMSGIQLWSMLQFDGFIFVGTLEKGVYMSTDYGLSWSERNVGLSFGKNLLTANNQYLYSACESDGIFRTKWEDILPTPITSQLRPMIIDNASDNTMSFNLYYKDNQHPQFIISSDNESIIPISSINITGTGRERTLAISPLSNCAGEANICVTVTDGVDSTSRVFKVLVNTLTSVDNNISTIISSSIHCYPNPANSDIRFDFANNENELARLTIIDPMGNEIANLQTIEDYATYPTERLAIGVYFVRGTIGSQTLTGKFVVAR